MTKRSREQSFAACIRENDSGLLVDDDETEIRRTSAEGHTPKYALLDEMAEDGDWAMRCTLPPHEPLQFATFYEYEQHVRQTHSHQCSECQAVFPTGHFFDLHVAETHDPIVAAKQAAGEKIYACFVEGCDKVCLEWQKRRRHLVDKHGFPRNYDFLVVTHGVAGRRSMLRAGVDAQGHRKSSRGRGQQPSLTNEPSYDTEATSIGKKDTREAKEKTRRLPETVSHPSKMPDVDDLTRTMSSLHMIPRSITFGRPRGRSGFTTS